MADFSRLTPKHRELLELRSRGWSLKGCANLLKVKYSTIQSRQAAIRQILGVRTIEEALEIWGSHPCKENRVLWDVVDTLRKEARKCR